MSEEAPKGEETRNRIFQRLQFLQALEQRLELNLLSVRTSMKELADLLRKEYFPAQPDPTIPRSPSPETPPPESKTEA